MPSGPFGGPRPLAKCRLFFNVRYRTTGRIADTSGIEREVKEQLERKDVMEVSDTAAEKKGNEVVVRVGTNSHGLTNDQENQMTSVIERIIAQESNRTPDFLGYEFTTE